jgi:LysR substrate binding domain
VAPVLAPHQPFHARRAAGDRGRAADVAARAGRRLDLGARRCSHPCGLIPAPDGIANEAFCAEPLLVGLRPEHRLAGQAAVALADLTHDVLGTTPADLFPGWALSQRQALEQAGISPPTIDLADTDLTATRWAEQQDIEWILLIPSLAAAHTTTVIRPTSPAQLVPFTLQWNPNRAHTMAVARFVHAALTAELPPGWHTQPDHLHHHPGLAP